MQEIFGKVNKIFSYYEKYGSSDYIGEPVTQIEHMTQGAMFAELDHQKPEIVIAMFLHDIGHLLVEDNPELMGDLGVANHEKIGRKFLEDGCKLKVTLMFRGRELARVDLGKVVMEKVIEQLSDIAEIEKDVPLEGRRMSMILNGK